MQWHRVGHRGAPKEFPANTMRSFQRALEYGCTMMECDIQQAANGVPVLAHDPVVTDKSGQRYVIAEHSSDVLYGIDMGVGEGLPTLAELALWAQGRCAIMADMKCEGNGIEARVVEALSVLPMEELILSGASKESRPVFQALAPMLPLSLTLSNEYRHLLEGADFSQIDTTFVTWEHPLLDTETVAALHAHHLKIFAWTVDDLPTMQRLVALGVEGIISNRPELLATLR